MIFEHGYWIVCPEIPPQWSLKGKGRGQPLKDQLLYGNFAPSPAPLLRSLVSGPRKRGRTDGLLGVHPVSVSLLQMVCGTAKNFRCKWISQIMSQKKQGHRVKKKNKPQTCTKTIYGNE